MPTKQSWEFEQGDAIVPGRTALKSLGGGTSYEVYLAWDERLFAVVVTKILRPNLVEKEGELNDLRREAELVARLAHPVIVRSFGYVMEGPRPHIVLEHLEGPNLRSLLKKYGALPLEQLLPLSLQLCAAIHYLSAEEVVHLDVKPSNIIMGAPPRLIDMSIARTFERAKHLKSSVGTAAYMAPEQCSPRDHPEIAAPADMWGLGVTLYQAITGHRPFSAPGDREVEDPYDRFPQLLEPPEPLPKDVPSALAEPVMACLSKDPTDRPTAGELAVALEPLVAALPRKPVLGRRRPRLR